MRTTFITSALAALSLVAITAPAAGETRRVAVFYGDLNLGSAAGMATLDGRLRAATRQVCGTAHLRSVRDTLDQRACVRSTRASVAIEIARLTGNGAVLALNDIGR